MKVEWKEEKGIPPRILLFRDGEEVRKISPRIVSSRELRGIDAPTWEAFERILFLLEEKGGIRVALASLSRRSYHSQKLSALLKRYFLPEAIIERVISWCKEKGYLDDTSWEEQRVSSLRARGKSAKDIVFRLKREGVACDIQKDDKDVLERLILKKYPALLREDTPRKEKAKSIQALLRRGFSFQDIQIFLSKV